MTTIATDGKTIAADRLVTGDGITHGYVDKLHRTDNGDIIGITGTAFQYEPFLQWYNGDRKDPPDINDGMEALVLQTDGTVRCYNEKGQSFEHSVPAAAGSGSAIAYGAMLAGANPAAAVLIACDRDLNTGGPVDVMSHE